MTSLYTTSPAVLALDFDGVLCDGMREYFESAWRAWRRLRPGAPEAPPASLFDRFARLRPLVETGWEMVALVHALASGAADEAPARDWRPATWLAELGCTRDAATAALDGVRDAWIARDERGWLDSHRFYEGVIARLQRLAGPRPVVYVVTTKEGRFARQLLLRQGVRLPEAQVLGKEVRWPKRETLRELAARHAGGDARGIWFVEDRLATLQDVETDETLAGARLFLAAWGYNTPAHREAARRDDRIALLALEQFARDFAAWPAPGA
jgi:phosphoglycolate phosphatase-like HAD superfamily hydrolase